MVAVFIYGLMDGNPALITIGWDGNSTPRGCGYSDGTLKDETTGNPGYGYLYFATAPTIDQFKSMTENTDLMAIQAAATDLLSQGACVTECPMTTGDVKCLATSRMVNNSDCDETICECNLIESDGAVPLPFRYDTKQVLGFCVPYVTDDSEGAVKVAIEAMITAFTESEQGSNISAKMQSWMKDVALAWPMIAVSSVTALIFGYLYLFVIRLIGGGIIWFTIILLELLLLGGGAYTWFYKGLKYRPEDPMFDYMSYAAYTLWGLCAVLLILVCCFWHAIKIGIAVFKTTSQYVQANMKIFILPAISYLIIAFWFIFWLIGAVHVFSVGTPEPRDDGYPFLTIMRWEPLTRGAFFYDVFGLFWINAFIIGVTQFIIGASACLWYFEQSTETKGEGTVGRAFYWSYRYHLGSVAFGSFIIAVCQMMRFLFEYYRKKIGIAEKTKVVKALLCLTGYLLYLMDKCVKYISKNAYIQVALTNNHFFKSAWNGFALIIKNIHRFGAANSIGAMFMFFGGCMIMALNGGLAWLALTQFTFITVTSPIPPVVVICIISGTISYTFLSIFSFSSDAILQSFLLDEELRFAGNDRPEYMQDFAEELKKRGKGCCN